MGLCAAFFSVFLEEKNSTYSTRAEECEERAVKKETERLLNASSKFESIVRHVNCLSTF